MQKKILVLAVAAAISTPAFADNANITFYGKAILNVEAASNDKSTSQAKVQTNASRFGMKGSEELGDGMKGLFQFELEMDADGSGNTATTTASGTGTPAAATYTTTPTPSGLGKSRNSGAGLEGGFGKVMVGIWDTPFKLAHNKIELFDNTTSFSATKLIGLAYKGTTKIDYNSRQKNSVNYWSPKFGGVELAAAYKADETTNYKNMVSASVTYDADGMYLSAAYESRPDQSGTNVTDTASRVVAQYNFGDFWIGAAFESIKVDTATASTSFTQNNTEVAASMKMGASSLGLAYVKAGQNYLADTGATQVSVRYGYGLSKRTEVFAAYSNLKNEAAIKYTLGAGTATNGATETVAGVGIVHSF